MEEGTRVEAAVDKNKREVGGVRKERCGAESGLKKRRNMRVNGKWKNRKLVAEKEKTEEELEKDE